MSDFYNEAKKKLDEGVKARLDKYGEVMKQAVHDALLNFIAQDEEFAQAVVQGGSFADAMQAVAKEIKGQSISDMEAYGAAVRFFFPGAEIRVSMTIDLIGEGAGRIGMQHDNNAVIIDLSEFF